MKKINCSDRVTKEVAVVEELEEVTVRCFACGEQFVEEFSVAEARTVGCGLLDLLCIRCDPASAYRPPFKVVPRAFPERGYRLLLV